MMNLLNRYFTKTTWYSFADVLKIASNLQSELISPSYFDESDIYQFLINLSIDGLLYSEIFNSTDEKASQLFTKLFNKLVARYFNHYCFGIKQETLAEIGSTREFLMKLFNVYVNTFEKYNTMLNLYQSSANELMKKLETISEGGTRFNDTPQVEEVNIDFESNKFTTTLTKMKNVVSADSDTPIKKLEEIARNYRHLLLEWTNEFDNLFVEEMNI